MMKKEGEVNNYTGSLAGLVVLPAQRCERAMRRGFSPKKAPEPIPGALWHTAQNAYAGVGNNQVRGGTCQT